MMRMHDAAETLRDMHQHELGMQTLAEFKGYDKVAGQYCEKAEALQTGISALEGLERNKAKAEKILEAFRCCRPCPMDCGSCPYQGDSFPSCAKRMDDDIEELLVAAYAEGGESNEQD